MLGFNKIDDRLKWKYFVGEYKPNEEKRLEKIYKGLVLVDREALREERILLDVFSSDKDLKKELGVNPYNLYSIGEDTFVNFRDLSNLVVYKVHDYTQSETLFGDDFAKDKTEYSADNINKLLFNGLPNDRIYLKNFAKGYAIIKVPNSVNNADIKLQAITSDLGVKSTRFDKDTNTLIIEMN